MKNYKEYLDALITEDYEKIGYREKPMERKVDGEFGQENWFKMSQGDFVKELMDVQELSDMEADLADSPDRSEEEKMEAHERQLWYTDKMVALLDFATEHDIQIPPQLKGMNKQHSGPSAFSIMKRRVA